jgi:peptidoglycan hydrolase-like protein with peptidoglycan-binding domain
MLVKFVFTVASGLLAAVASAASMPLPFTRVLKLASPYLTGNDVIIAQNLLIRDNAVSPISTDGVFGQESERATRQFQEAHGISSTGQVDAETAQRLLDLHSADGVKDSGFTAASMGYKYKIFIPVHKNRSIETAASLYDANNRQIFTFPVRTHGHRDDGSSVSWPDFGNGDVGLNQFTSNGATVTGLLEIDLNSPEPNPELYGPWPVNRIVRGLKGNGAFLLPYIRDGMLIHTGNWTSGGWTPRDTMPNSAGCIHSHPNDVYRLYMELTALGVVANPNTFSGKNYPYKPQGIAVIELQDE